MHILISGASGFIGTILVDSLSKNHKITVLGRTKEKLERHFSGDIHKITWQDLENTKAQEFDLIINLCGSNIGNNRWSPAVKKELIESRTTTNKQLIEWLIQQNAKPRFFSANAVGIYGAQNMSFETFDEDSELPIASDDFLQSIGLHWEQSLKLAIDANIPVTTLRFGVVLKQGEGMLKKLELPYRLGLGSIVGNGEQILSWVHYKDLIEAVQFIIDHPVTGPVNITSPFPVTQKEFAKELALVMQRPLFIKMPAWFITLLFGEMGEYLLLKGQQVLPKRLNALEFTFKYPLIINALKEEYHQ